ncbi:hypothetical protein V2J09_016566 [Rumex salicifolius]
MEFRSLAAAGEGSADATRNAESVVRGETRFDQEGRLGRDVGEDNIDHLSVLWGHIYTSETMYMSKSLSCKVFLKQRLYGLKMSESSDLVQHINTFNKIIGDLGRVGMKVDVEDQAIILPYSLTPAYETLRLALGCFLITSDENIPAVISLRVLGCILATTKKGEDKGEANRWQEQAEFSVKGQEESSLLWLWKNSEIAQTENRTVRRILRDLQSLQTWFRMIVLKVGIQMLSVTPNSHTDLWILDSRFRLFIPYDDTQGMV